jgi:hypothetical protein
MAQPGMLLLACSSCKQHVHCPEHPTCKLPHHMPCLYAPHPLTQPLLCTATA